MKITALLFFLLTGSLWAATYYVDYSSGSDQNNGTSPKQAFQHCPGDTNAVSQAESTVLL